jgi:hypothetical protein
VPFPIAKAFATIAPNEGDQERWRINLCQRGHAHQFRALERTPSRANCLSATGSACATVGVDCRRTIFLLFATLVKRASIPGLDLYGETGTDWPAMLGHLHYLD